MHKVLFGIIIAGIVILAIGLVFIAIKSQTKLVSERIVNNATVKFNNQDTSMLIFNASNPSYRLEIDLELIEIKYGGISIDPLAYIVMVDEQGWSEIKANKTISYAYLTVEGLDESKSFSIDNLSGEKRFYLLFSTPLPEQEARVDIDMIYAKTPQSISILDIILIASGISVIVAGMIANRL